MRRFLSALVLTGLALAPLHAGTEILLYPLARAFGGPSESELARCRLAFQRLQAWKASGTLVVQPVLVRPGAAPGDASRDWRPELAEAICRQAARAGLKATVADTAPAVAPTKFGHNQMRYLWERADQYSQWVKAAHPVGDFFLFVEIFSRDGKVGAIQVVALEASGQIAYCRLFNSHQFGGNLSSQGDTPIRLIVKRLSEDLRRDAIEVFPRYGVG